MGDFTPRSNIERTIGALVLLSGVAVFSFLIGNFIEILSKYQELNASFDDGDTLSKFFATLTKFNDMNQLELGLKHNIEDHFDYIWRNDKN